MPDNANNASNNTDNNADTPLALCTTDELWRELSSRCEFAILAYAPLPQRTGEPMLVIETTGTIVQLVGAAELVRIDIHARTHKLRFNE